MALKNGIRTLLLAQSSVTSLCGSQTVDNVSVPAIFVQAPRQGIKTPYVVISRTSHDPMKTLDGTTGMAQTEIDIDCFAATETKADALAKVVSDFFKDYTGVAGASDTIDAVLWEDMNDFENPEGDGSDTWRYAVTLTFTVFHH